MSTNNPRERKQRLQQTAEEVANVATSYRADPSASFDVTGVGEESGSIPSHPSVGQGTVNPPKITSSDLPPITVPGANSTKAKINATGNRPKVKPYKKVGGGTSEEAPIIAGSGSFADASAVQDASGSLTTTGSTGIAGTGGLQTSSPEGQQAQTLGVEGADLSGFDMEPEVDHLLADDQENTQVDGVAAAQSFRLEKQIEREQVAEKRIRVNRRRKIAMVVGVSIVVLLIAFVVTVCVAFSVFRWHTYDDAADIQGTWYIAGTETPITITEDTIKLTDSVAYRYVMDPEAKTIQFMFGNMKGQAHYRFSLDRNKLAIKDGEFSWSDTLMDDADWTFGALMDKLQGKPDRVPGEDDEGSLFERH